MTLSTAVIFKDQCDSHLISRFNPPILKKLKRIGELQKPAILGITKDDIELKESANENKLFILPIIKPTLP